jgi:hypothetical protein
VRKLVVLVLALACLAQAAPLRLQGKLKGVPPESKPLALGTLKGKLITCQGKLFGSTGMHEAQLVRFSLKLTNVSRAKGFYAVHVALFDKNGELLGSGGEQEVYGLEAGKVAGPQFDLFMPKADLKRVASYQVILYESNSMLGKK